MNGTEPLEALREAVAALGPWFHNIDLGGVMTAPDHFLGDYPAVKWRRFAHTLPADLRGKTVLDIGCNAGFYSIQMKLRGASRVLAVDHDPDYLRQARFAAEVSEADSNIDHIETEQRASHQYTTILFTIQVRNRMHLANVFRRLRRIPEVVRIQRLKKKN